MFRKGLIELLHNHPRSVTDLARLLGETPRDVENGLQHLQKSLKNSSYQMTIIPAACRKCGFVFDRQKLRKPGKCPACKGTWISEPLIGIEER
jgi:transcriptional regulator